jgi:hypothetical protein
MNCKPDENLRCIRCGAKLISSDALRNCQSARKRFVVSITPVGSLLRRFLSRVGVTESLISRIAGVADCGCKSRAARLDAASAAASRKIEAILNGIVDFLLGA